MTQNSTKQKYIKSAHISNKWAKYEAQPLHVREWLQSHPLNIWPGSYQNLASVMAATDRQYLLGLESVWGPDHPAVQDAKLRVTTKGRKVVEVLNLDDLDLAF
jgi:hypothetical protein